MTSLGFENYAEALKIYLSKYREVRLVQQIQAIAVRLYTDFFQTQSARGENQNRPPSSGYGAGGAMGGAVSAPQAGRSAAAPMGAFPDADHANSILNPGLDPSEQDASAYGYPAMVGQPHNGTGGEPY